MSVAELPRAAAEFERTPPQDITAEQCVLGGMLLSKDAIADVVEMLRAPDFYRPAHQTVYDTVLDLYGRGEPADAVTVAAELTKRGEIARIGGAGYLHTLIASVPTAANASYYARIVHERAVLRRLVEAGTRIAQMGYAADGSDADDVVDRAQAEIYSVTDRRASEDYLPLSAIMEGTLDEIEAIGSRGGQMVGVPTGFGDLDQLTNGLHAGQMIILAARPAIGKALALDTLLPTPTGWTTMGEVAVGDEVFGADGQSTTVVAATDVMSGRPCFEVEFSDGTVIVADAEHQWLTETRASRKSAHTAAVGDNRYRNQRTFADVRTTAEIAKTVRCNTAGQRLNHAVVNAQPLQLPDAKLPLPPYVLGVWLADSHAAGSRFTTADGDIVSAIETDGLRCTSHRNLLYTMYLPQPEIGDRTCILCGVRCRLDHGTVAARLRGLGVVNNRHIPRAYLRASERQRRQLLAGLLDTAGTVSPTGATQFAVTNKRLARDTYELIVSLGYRCGVTTKRVRGRTLSSSTAFTLTFSPPDTVFRLPRKQQMHRDRVHRHSPVVRTRFITAVRPVASVPVRCIQVDNDEGLFLASRSMIPTHNSTLGLDIARSAAIRHGLPSVIFSLEMSRNEITMRLLSAEARVALHHMRSGTMSDDDWARLARRMGEVSSAPLFIDDSPNMSMMEIRAKCRRLKQRHDLRLVIVDYMQLMSSAKRVENRQQEVSEFSRSMKLLAKELDVPVVAISQLNRGPEQRQDKRPLLSDLRESGSLEQDSDMVILLHREDAYERESPRAGEADLIVAKHRNGPTATITVAFQGHYSRFVDMAQS